MKYFSFNSKFLIKLFFSIAVLVELGLFIKTSGKCTMREPCSMHSSTDIDDAKWYNCPYDGEPEALDDPETAELIRDLCPALFAGHDDLKAPLCCSKEQIIILNKDLKNAESLIGNCPSCYFNFRNMWCHLTCSPNQADFVVAKTTAIHRISNYTNLINQEALLKNKDETETEETEESSNNEQVAEKSDESVENNQNNVMGKVVTELYYFINENFVENLIESCKGVKFYNTDALLFFCNSISKECTPHKFLGYLGLNVMNRPFDIYINHSDLTEIETSLSIKHTNIENVTHHIEKVFKLKPVIPNYHPCSEGFSYFNKSWLGCGCKDCDKSCIFYENFKVFRKHEFDIGPFDGVTFIMTALFVLFATIFLKSISFLQYVYIRLFRRKGSTFIEQENCMWKRSDLRHTEMNENIPSKKIDQTADNFLDREPSNKNLPICLNCLEKLKYWGSRLERFIQIGFTRLGKFCASCPAIVLVIGLCFCALMCLGYVNFKVEKDPIKLWSSNSSVARQNKKYFDENFNPFYRITQLIIEPKSNIEPKLQKLDENTESKSISILQPALLNETLQLYARINSLVARCPDCGEMMEEVRLEDICFQPMKPDYKKCAIQSIFQYWKNSYAKIEEELNDHPIGVLKKIDDCAKNPYLEYCLSEFGGPMQPFIGLGSYEEQDFLEAKSIVFTYIINNFADTESLEVKRAMAWELAVLDLLQNYSSKLIEIHYTTQRSIEDELDRESKADIKIIAISYLMMFFYLTVTLGKYTSSQPKMILLEMKIFLGLAGVILVLLSVFASGGFFTLIGVPATLITLEVIPFLLLAVGVDNIYVMVQTYQNDERLDHETVEDQISRIVGKVGPSMLLTGTTQTAAFLISALTPMPGVRAFSLYASLAIILNFILQITCFVALLTIDAKREKSKRVDIFCCVKLNIDDSQLANRKSFLHRYFRDVYTPFLFNNYVRATVILFFVGFFFACIAMCDKIKIGLDQRLTMPTDSYQIRYFEALQKHSKVGPPVYFVVKDGFNYSDTNSMRLLCGSSSCDPESLQSIISSAAFFANSSYIAQPPVNWIDDYFDYLSVNPKTDTTSECCHVNSETGAFCTANEIVESSLCQPCIVQRSADSFPTEESFNKYVQNFLTQNPDEKCIKNGHAMFGNAVKLEFNETNKQTLGIRTSHFYTHHTVLVTSDDFINAMISAQQICDKINQVIKTRLNGDTSIEVFPYSIFYVFYEQYVKIWADATMQLILTLAAIFVCTFILLSFDLFTALIVTGVIAIIIIDMVGVMFMWNIELNAISLVNLVIAIGISVEFNSHIARSFATSTAESRKERAIEALYTMGPPVFSGVLQSIVGISVLAFAHSQLFQVFYFRMYFSILLLGLSHGLVFLPVLLSYIGPSNRRPSLEYQNEFTKSLLQENKNIETKISNSIDSKIIKEQIVLLEYSEEIPEMEKLSSNFDLRTTEINKKLISSPK